MLPSKDASLKQIKLRKMTSRSFLQSGAPGGNRTPDPLLRRQTLYPTELRARSRGGFDSKAFSTVPKIESFPFSYHYTSISLQLHARTIFDDTGIILPKASSQPVAIELMDKKYWHQYSR
jgi:hypothetical protein